MAKVVKKLFSPLNLMGIIFSIIYSFLYLNGDLTLYDDVNNRNVTLFFYFDNIFPNLMDLGIRGFLYFLVNIPGETIHKHPFDAWDAQRGEGD